MLVTQRTLSHIGQLDGSLGTGVHEPITAVRMKLGSGNNFSEFLHVCRLDIDDVEALVLDIEIPEVDAKIVTADECLAIAVDRNAIDVISVGIGISTTRNRSHDGIVMGHSR